MSPAERKQKAEAKAARLAHVREANAATSPMVSPEPQRGLYVAAAMVALTLYSYLSLDVEYGTKTVKGKTVSVTHAITHPAQAILLFIFVLVAAGSIYWRKRTYTAIAFFVVAAIGFGTPLPKSSADVQYVAFLLPAGYSLSIWAFRMNKDKKDWLAKHYPARRRSGSGPQHQPPVDQERPDKRPTTGTSSGRSRRGSPVQTTSVTGRPLPTGSGRYTPPRPKSRAAQRKP